MDSDSPVAPRNASTAYSTRDGTSITVHPSGVVFAIPVEWVKWHYQHRDNLHLSGTALAGVKDADQNEWDPEFARVCNAALPFDRCAAHVGGEGWGAQGHSFGDIQLRVYDFLDSPSNLEERIVKGAPRGAREAEIKRESDGVWSRVLVCYKRRFYDYGATAYVDFRIHLFGSRTLVFVFMCTNLESRDKVGKTLSLFLVSVQLGK